MTTIAYRSGIMAADSSCLSGNTHEHDVRKVFRIGGALVGACGRLGDIMRFRMWLNDGADPAKFVRYKDGFEAVIARADGKVVTFDGYAEHPVEALSAYVAIGAGAEVSLGAMFAGADARTAVKAAVKHNTNTKGPVRCYKLQP